MVGRLGIVLVAALLIVVAPPLLANTPIPAHGDVIVFSDKAGGNEWWVEAVLSGGASGSVQAVDSMDTGGPWVAMAYHADWGAWAASYHVESGHLVRFRASWAGGEMVESCWFTHPAGVEQTPCGTTTTSTSTSTTTPPSGCFAATFAIKSPNEWWQELYPAASGHTINAAQVRVNNGAWQSMSFSSWGAWTSSVHTVAGSKVEFLVHDTAGGSSTSLPFTWLDGSLSKGSAACGSTSSSTTASSSSSSSSTSTSPPPPTFKATYSGVQGNEWWIQTNVATTGGTLSKVDVRLFPGGGWGVWQPLTHQSWGGWAASYNARSGTIVQFRATSTAAATSLSGCYQWTTAAPVACPAPWPQEGMTLAYSFQHIIEDTRTAETLRWEQSWSNLTETFHDSDWQGTCTEHKHVGRYSTDPNATDTTTTVSRTWHIVADTSGGLGHPVEFFVPKGCSDSYTVDGQKEADWYTAVPSPDGSVPTIGVADFVQLASPPPSSFDTYWVDAKADKANSLVTNWDAARLMSGCECYYERNQGHIVRTDIPLGPVVSRAAQKTAEGAWPVDGSHLQYVAESQKPDGWHNQTWVQVDYHADTHLWTGTCQVNTGAPDGHYIPQTTESVSFPAVPSGPGGAAVGSTVQVQLPRRCILTPVDTLVGGPTTADYFGPPGGGSDGAEWHTIEVQSGQGTASPPEGTAHWDPETGLLMDWDWTLPDGAHLYGRQVNMDLHGFILR